MTVRAVGVQTKVALSRAAVWATEVVHGALDGLLCAPPTIKRSVAEIPDESIGVVWHKMMDTGEVTCEGEIPADLRYLGFDLLIGLIMGASGGAPVQQGATAAYKQTFTLADDLDGLFASLAAYNGIDVTSVPSVKFNTLTIRGEIGKAITIKAGFVGNDRIVDSVINTSVTFADVTYPDEENRVLMRQGVFYMDDQDAAAVDTAIYPNAFEITITRPMKGLHGVANSLDTIDEPTSDGISTVTMKVEFPQYQAAQKQTFVDWAAGTAKKFRFLFTGLNIEGAYDNEFEIQIPNAVITNVEAPIGTGIIPQSVDLACLAVDAAPDGLTATLPIQITVQNTNTVDVLA